MQFCKAIILQSKINKSIKNTTNEARKWRKDSLWQVMLGKLNSHMWKNEIKKTHFRLNLALLISVYIEKLSLATLLKYWILNWIQIIINSRLTSGYCNNAMDLEKILLSEMSDWERDTYDTTYMWNLKHVQINVYIMRILRFFNGRVHIKKFRHITS